MKDLKGRKKDIYEFIEKTVKEKSIPPSIREICEAVGLKSPSSVHAYLNELQQDGYINKDDRKMRTITLAVADADRTINVPVIGRVTAGKPILAVEEITGYVRYDPQGGTGDYFALNVVGDSMINAGILDGDLVIVRKQQTANNGEIVVAMIDDEATVKRFHKENGVILLKAENPAYDPIDGAECEILGRVCALLRNI